MIFDWTGAYEAVEKHYGDERAYDDDLRSVAREEVEATIEACDIEPFEEGIRIATYETLKDGNAYGVMASIGNGSGDVCGGLMVLSTDIVSEHDMGSVRPIARHELAHLVDTRRNGATFERADHFKEILSEFRAPHRPADLHTCPVSVKEL